MEVSPPPQDLGGSPRSRRPLQQNGSSRSRWLWVERFLFFSIGSLVAVGILYGHPMDRPFEPSDLDMLTASLQALRVRAGGTPLPPPPMANQVVGKEARENKEPEKEPISEPEPKDGEQNQQQQRQEAEQETGRVETETAEDPTKGRLNVVLFYADDWTQKVMGKLNPDVHTPNIDRMADNGMIFANNCVTSSVCWMSRATLMTGVYASRHLQSEPFIDKMFYTNPWSETLFPLLKGAGYYTGLVGKWHSLQPQTEIKQAFDHSKFYYGEHWFEHFGGVRKHVTDMNREDGLEFLQKRPRDRNFALKVSFFATHAWDGHYPSYEPMNGTRATHYPDNVTIAPPRTATEQHWNDLPPLFTEANEGRNRWRKRFEPDYFQDNIKDIYSMATEVDWAVGEIIEELKQQGVYDNTILIFTTDNGNLHGEHGLTEKWYPFEESIRVPLVIQDPRMPLELHGTTNGAMTLNVDLAPTILGAANLSPSSFMQGRDIGDLYLPGDGGAARGADWRKDWFYEFNMGDPVTAAGHPQKGWIDASFALVTEEWKYILWPEHDYEQLFHRSVDAYDEWDLLDQRKNHTDVQTTMAAYEKLKARFTELKERAQGGHKV